LVWRGWGESEVYEQTAEGMVLSGLKSNYMARGLSPAGAQGATVDSRHWPAATWHILSVGWIRFVVPLPLRHNTAV
jgi:hypothetical protein